MMETFLLVKPLLFIDYLRFMVLGNFIKDIRKTFKKVVETVIEWNKENAVIYNTLKAKSMFFLKSHCQILSKQLQETKVVISSKKV